MTEQKLTQEQIAAIRARWAGVKYTGPQIDPDGYLNVVLDESYNHSIGWDIEGTSQCCTEHLERIAAAPTDIAALLAHAAALEAELAEAARVFEAARAMIERGPHYAHYNTSIDRLDALRDALAALEGESDE